MVGEELHVDAGHVGDGHVGDVLVDVVKHNKHVDAVHVNVIEHLVHTERVAHIVHVFHVEATDYCPHSCQYFYPRWLDGAY